MALWTSAGALHAAEAPPAAVAPLPVSPAPANGDVDAHVALGHRLSQLGRYEDAVAEFRRAYELRAEPRLLFEIAETYQRLGAASQAIFYYDRYLASVPGAPERPEIEAKVATLSGAHKPARPRPHMVSEATLAADAGSPPPARPWRRWWFWTALGVVVGTGATAVVLSRRGGTDVPATALGDQKFFQ